MDWGAIRRGNLTKPRAREQSLQKLQYRISHPCVGASLVVCRRLKLSCGDLANSLP